MHENRTFLMKVSLRHPFTKVKEYEGGVFYGVKGCNLFHGKKRTAGLGFAFIKMFLQTRSFDGDSERQEFGTKRRGNLWGKGLPNHNCTKVL